MITTEDPCAVADNNEEPFADLKQELSQERQLEEASPDVLSLQAQASAAQQKAKEEASKENKLKSVGTPRKRIVSDGHWKRKRTPPKSADKPKPKTKVAAKSKSVDEGIRIIPTLEKISDERGKERDLRTVQSPSQKKKPTHDDGIRVYATPPGSRRPSVQKAAGSSNGKFAEDAPDNDEARSLRSRSVSPRPNSVARSLGSPDAPMDQSPLSASCEPLSSKKSSGGGEIPNTPGDFLQGSSKDNQRPVQRKRTSKKPTKGIFAQVFDESKKMFSRTETVYVQPPENPRIDAWLGGVPDPGEDPFVAEELPIDEPPVEIPAPLNIKSRRKRTSKESEVTIEDTNKIWESISTRESLQGTPSSRPRRRRPERRRSSSTRQETPLAPSNDIEAAQLDEEVTKPSTPLSDNVPLEHAQTSPSSPSRLQRRNARRKSIHSPKDSPKSEPRQSSPLKESFTFGNDEKESNVSSANTESSVEPIDPNNPLKPPPLTTRRPFPSVGKHRLSTILSVDTLGSKAQSQAKAPSVSEFSDDTVQPNTQESKEMQDESKDQFDPTSLGGPSVKSRLTRHADLISVLSAPRGCEKSIRSARSIRTNRSRLETATIDDVMRELADDETKYMRELRTLVDGVIPVLLSCVLSKTESAIAAGLFSPQGNAAKDPAITKPIIDMGICLERLKAWHKRVEPYNGRSPSVTSFLNWAQGVHRTYADYLKSWRMGFQDVVVNLAPGTVEERKKPGVEDGLPRNEHGDVTDSNGERVDVAYLLKRPLVRLKYLAKTLRGINYVMPSAQAEKLAVDFQSLVEEARNRANEERARLEDEAAANIDPTRARDLRTLGPLSGTLVKGDRRVRARDSFSLTLSHSSGQMIDCRVELLLRDDPPGAGTDADFLICEVDGTGRWLLFPPIATSNVSARNGDAEGEIIVMIRGSQSSGQKWHELLSLVGDEEQAGFEWVQMLGLMPVPPQVTTLRSLGRAENKKALEVPKTNESIPSAESGNVSTTPAKSRTPSPRDIAVPLGEQPARALRSWNDPSEDPQTSSLQDQQPPKSRTRLQKRRPLSSPEHRMSDSPLSPVLDLDPDSGRKELTDSPPAPGRSIEEQNSPGDVGSGLRRYRKNRESRGSPGPPSNPYSPDSSREESLPALEPESARPGSSTRQNLSLRSPSTPDSGEISESLRPRYHRRTSSTPSMELPKIQKTRKDSQPSSPAQEKIEESCEPAESALRKTPKKITKARPQEAQDETPPTPPQHRTPSPRVKLECSRTPDFSPGLRRMNRRSSSPLKHEYEPSTATESSSESDTSTIAHEERSSMSDTSDDEEGDSEHGDIAMPLLPIGALQRSRQPPKSLPSLPSRTLGPSSSASQAPYKTVPSQPQKAAKTIATIFYWSDKGTWEVLHPDECSIAITPGLIEAYEMSAAHSFAEEQGLTSSKSATSSGQSSTSSGPRPLIALELTPLVPIRRGTALDISIRSPPTAGSKITAVTNNNVMFRSRSPEECEALYALINYARINNPTYIALQNARATSFNPQLVNAGIARGKTTRSPSSSWFGLGRRRSYRASSAPTPSISKTESSIGSATSAFSALKLFKGSSRFNIHRSTILSRTSSRTGSVYTSSDNSSGSGTSTPVPPGAAALGPQVPGIEGNAAPIGLSNAKIRLYIRESASKWRDLGAARLTIMRPTNASHPVAPSVSGHRPSSSSSSPPSSREGSSGGPAEAAEQKGTAFGIGAGGAASPGRRQSANDKRIVVIGKGKGDTLLDVTLGETCFERVARTGIAVSVWENFEGGMVAKEGGVVGGRLRVFMVQVSLLC